MMNHSLKSNLYNLHRKSLANMLFEFVKIDPGLI